MVGKVLGLRYAQFMADLLNSFWRHYVVEDEIRRIKENASKYDVCIDVTFTGLNQLLHPSSLMREVAFQWYKNLLTITAELGVGGRGSHFGILKVRDYEDPVRCEELTSEVINYGLLFGRSAWFSWDENKLELVLGCGVHFMFGPGQTVLL